MKVRLYLRVRLPNGNRQYVDPVYAANGKLRPLFALVDGKADLWKHVPHFQELAASRAFFLIV